jgi:hypothetical protein
MGEAQIGAGLGKTAANRGHAPAIYAGADVSGAPGQILSGDGAQE